MQTGDYLDAWLLLCAGVVLFVAVFWGKQFDPVRTPEAEFLQETRLLWIAEPWAVRTGLGLLALSILLTVNALQQFHDFEPFAPQAWWWHGASLLAILIAAVLLDYGLGFAHSSRRGDTEAERSAEEDRERHPRRYIKHAGLVAALTMIVAVAIFLRLLRSGDLPYGVWYD
ncbi:MAG: hypothetical protein R6W76_03900, partial [Caldilinea sp.]